MLGHLMYYPRTQVLGHLNTIPGLSIGFLNLLSQDTQALGPLIYLPRTRVLGRLIYYPRTQVLGHHPKTKCWDTIPRPSVGTLHQLSQDSSVGTLNLLSQDSSVVVLGS